VQLRQNADIIAFTQRKPRRHKEKPGSVLKMIDVFMREGYL